MTFAILSSADLTKKIGSIGTRGAKLVADIHLVAVHAIAHAVKHGDVTIMGRLIDAFPKRLSKTAMIAFAEQVGPFVWDLETKVFKKDKEATGDRAKFDDARAEFLLKLDWQDFKPVKAEVVFDMIAALEKVLKKARAEKVSDVEIQAVGHAVEAIVKARTSRKPANTGKASDLVEQNLKAA